MRTHPRTLLAMLASSLVPLGLLTPSPAGAETSPSVAISVADVVAWDGCEQYPFAWTVADMPADKSWIVGVDFVAPNGNAASKTALTGTGPASGTETFQLCDNQHVTGTYTVGGALHWGNFNLGTGPVTGNPFSVRRPATTTRLTATPRRPRPGQRVRLSVVTHVETASGYQRRPTDVRLQRKTGRGWKKAGRLSAYDAKRRFRVRYRGGKVRYRAVVRASEIDNHDGSRDAITLKGRR